MNMDIFANIILVGAIQGFLLSVLILNIRRIVFNRLFSLVLFWVSIALLVGYLQMVLDITRYPFLIKVNLLFPLIFIPLLYIYLKKITGASYRSKGSMIYLFVPLMVVFFFNLPFYLSNPDIKIDYYLRYELHGKPTLKDIFEEIFVELTLTIYSVLAILEVRNYKNRIDEVYSSHSKTRIGWIRFLAWSMFTLTFFALVLSVGMLLINSIPVGFFLATAVGATIIIYYVAYFFLLHPNALADISLNLRQSAGISAFNEPHQQKKNDSILPDFELKINHLLDTEKIYQKPDITIGELAHRAHIPVYLTSKIINQRLNTNFYSLINQYRLRQVKHELLQNPNKTIIEIAYNAGFNSKTSFYEAFKKDTGLSPSEFIRKNQSDK